MVIRVRTPPALYVALLSRWNKTPGGVPSAEQVWETTPCRLVADEPFNDDRFPVVA